MSDDLMDDYRRVYPSEAERAERALSNPDAVILPRNKYERDAFDIAEDNYMYCQQDDVVVPEVDICRCENYGGEGLCEVAWRGECNAYKVMKFVEEQLAKGGTSHED